MARYLRVWNMLRCVQYTYIRPSMAAKKRKQAHIISETTLKIDRSPGGIPRTWLDDKHGQVHLKEVINLIDGLQASFRNENEDRMLFY